MRRFLVYAIALGFAVGGTAQAQRREVTGRVTVGISGRPLADALVAISGQAVGVRTNERGEFRITVPTGDVNLFTRAIGYKRVTKRVPAGTTTTDFVLERDVLELEGVIVTGAATTIDRRN